MNLICINELNIVIQNFHKIDYLLYYLLNDTIQCTRCSYSVCLRNIKKKNGSTLPYNKGAWIETSKRHDYLPMSISYFWRKQEIHRLPNDNKDSVTQLQAPINMLALKMVSLGYPSVLHSLHSD